MSSTSSVRILILGAVHPRVRERVEAGFDGVSMESADPRLVSPELAASVRGITCAAPVDAAFIDALPKLEIIARFGVGYDMIDATHATRRTCSPRKWPTPRSGCCSTRCGNFRAPSGTCAKDAGPVRAAIR